jgi:hypothetical protein
VRALAVLLAAGCGSVTEVRVSVDNAGLSGVQTLRISVTNPEVSPSPIYDSQPLPVCRGGGGKCYDFPVSVTLVPGSRDARVRVEVDALGAGDAPLESQASVFTFVAGIRQKLDFFLYDKCAGQMCADGDLGCGADGRCLVVNPTGAPPKSIRRVSGTSGDTGGEASFTIPPPMAQAGDTVIVLVSSTFVTPDASWTAMRTFNGGTNYNLFRRQATSGESTDTAGYTFVSDTPGQLLQWVLLVYRGAAGVDDFFYDIGNQPYVFPSKPVMHDGLLVDMAGVGQNSGVCQMAPAPEREFSVPNWHFYERNVQVGVSGERTVTCDGLDPAGLFSVILY